MREAVPVADDVLVSPCAVWPHPVHRPEDTAAAARLCVRRVRGPQVQLCRTMLLICQELQCPMQSGFVWDVGHTFGDV